MFNQYTHNGMNLRKSVNNPKSRFERIRSYLVERGGSATKIEILRDVFGKEVHTSEDRKEHWKVRYSNGKVTHGWGTYVFNLGVKYGYFTLVRKNRTVYWTLNPLAQLVPLDKGAQSQADGSV